MSETSALRVAKRASTVLTGIILGAMLLGVPAAKATFPSATNGDIAFSRYTHQQSDIWLIHSDGSEAGRITDTPNAAEFSPDWNATGTEIVYTRCGTGPRTWSKCSLWKMNADGTSQIQLLERWGGSASWSPDGSKILLAGGWVINSDGSGLTQLLSGPIAFPEWSPDGTKVVFLGRQADEPIGIWVMDADGTNAVRLAAAGRGWQCPDWSPDGTSIVFSRDGNIWVMDADGTNQMRLTFGKRTETAPTYSPDGTRIVYERGWKYGYQHLWVMDADGTNRVQYTFRHFETRPDWQPA